MSLNSKYDGQPEKYEARRNSWLNRRRLAFIASRLRAWNLAAGSSVLEIGSGTGSLLRGLAPLFPTVQFRGLEPQLSYVEFSAAQTHIPNLSFSCGMAEGAAALLPAKFCAVLSNDMLHHADSVPAVVQSISAIAAHGCRWLAIEPNAWNPYAFLGQSLKSGERNFWPADYLRTAHANGWSLQARRYIFAIPSFVRASPPPWLQSVEQAVEGIPCIGGGVCLETNRPG